MMQYSYNQGVMGGLSNPGLKDSAPGNKTNLLSQNMYSMNGGLTNSRNMIGMVPDYYNSQMSVWDHDRKNVNNVYNSSPNFFPSVRRSGDSIYSNPQDHALGSNTRSAQGLSSNLRPNNQFYNQHVKKNKKKTIKIIILF